MRRTGIWSGAALTIAALIFSDRLISDEASAGHLLGLYQGMPCERFAGRLINAHLRYLALARSQKLPAGAGYPTRRSLARACRLATESHIKYLGFLEDGGTALNLIWISNDEKLESWSFDMATWSSVSDGQRLNLALIKGVLVQGAEMDRELTVERSKLLVKVTRKLRSPIYSAPCGTSERQRRFWVIDAGVAWTRCDRASLITVHSVHHLLDHSLNRPALFALREELRKTLRREGLLEIE
jgi:hypothetical protein